nr:MAG TPA: hypothetical protein [Caudoviricetes sp.]
MIIKITLDKLIFLWYNKGEISKRCIIKQIKISIW